MWHWLLQLLIFQKLGKSGFCTCHLQETITQWCMTMVMQTWYQLKAEELLLASTHGTGYEYVYLRNSWPLNFDYLFLGPTLYICLNILREIFFFPLSGNWGPPFIFFGYTNCILLFWPWCFWRQTNVRLCLRRSEWLSELRGYFKLILGF